MDSFVTQKAEFIFSNTTSMPKNEDISLNYLQVIVFYIWFVYRPLF